MLDKLNKEIAELEEAKRKTEEAMKDAPSGTLRCAVNKGCYQYYQGKQYLGKDKKTFIQKLAQRDYCEKIGKEIEKYLRELKGLRCLYEQNPLGAHYDEMHPARKAVVKPLIKSPQEIIKEFEQLSFARKKFEEDDLTEYITIRGERVRSKSEMIIANELNRYHIPYHYEMPMNLLRKQAIITIHPDFTVLNKRTGRKWILEHLGMMDRMGYVESAVRRLELYERNGFLLGKNLLISYETSVSPLRVNVLRSYIETYFC